MYTVVSENSNMVNQLHSEHQDLGDALTISEIEISEITQLISLVTEPMCSVISVVSNSLQPYGL